ncbi:hypothetical protein [Streptosporangium lutulentum]|uniref:Uncharacterized protein n=1 Tax=Streptosporangium lutulentum TaxID=1461250 RepID=A0ABT9QQG3_9ACTN|nr:hypothetical protein [Streptosporangium lutulentum]MDP9848139.1 hypothetical protein [Streptosporangium lutulentum]
MSETSPIESKWLRRVRLTTQGVVIVLGAVLMVWLSLTDLLAWAESPQGIGQSAFWAWLVALWLTLSPIALALQAGLDWRRGYSARRILIAAWGLIALSTIIQWEAGGSPFEIISRPIVLAIMLLMLRPVDPVDHADPEKGSSDG